MIKCPVCKGLGEIEKPRHDKDFQKTRERMVFVLHKEGFSIREIMRLLEYKSPRSVHQIIKK